MVSRYGFMLVDATLPRGAGALLGAAKQAGAPIRRIAPTHGHADHVGSGIGSGASS